MTEKKSIRIECRTWAELKDKKRKDETFNDTIKRLLKESGHM